MVRGNAAGVTAGTGTENCRRFSPADLEMPDLADALENDEQPCGPDPGFGGEKLKRLRDVALLWEGRQPSPIWEAWGSD